MRVKSRLHRLAKSMNISLYIGVLSRDIVKGEANLWGDMNDFFFSFSTKYLKH